MWVLCNSIPRCRIRILDSFGTDAQFNYGAYEGVIPGEKTAWARADINLRQIMTMFRKRLSMLSIQAAFTKLINYVNKTEWSQIRSVIVRVVNKIPS